MQGKAKKLLALMLALTLVFPVGLLAASAAGSNVPVIYCHGDQTIYKTDEDGVRHQLFDDDEYLTKFTDGIVPLIAKSIVSGDWTEYTEKALDVFLPAFEGYAPNPDGTLPENSDIEWHWSEATLRPAYYMGSHPVYEFHPDSRLSVMVLADQVEEYVQAVKRRTGAQKIILMGRCEGTAISSAYLYKYARPVNYANLESVWYINGTVNGCAYADAVLSGTVSIPANGGYYFLRNIDSYTALGEQLGGEMDAEILSLLKDTIEMLHETYGIYLTVDLVQRVYDALKDIFLAKLLKAYWAIMPCFVSTANEHYEEYKDYIFAEEGDKEKYANIIAATDDFHYNVQVPLADYLLEAAAAGVSVNAIAEYGTQQYPLNDECEYIGDFMISVESQSFGATTSKVNETLDQKYINRRTAEGKGKYISPDKQIDASTCLFPDNTWFVKNLIHGFPAQLDRFLGVLLADPANTVDTTKYGQFLQYDENQYEFYAATETSENDMVWENEDPGSGTRNFATRVGNFLIKIINFVRSIIDGIVAHANGLADPITVNPLLETTTEAP